MTGARWLGQLSPTRSPFFATFWSRSVFAALPTTASGSRSRSGFAGHKPGSSRGRALEQSGYLPSEQVVRCTPRLHFGLQMVCNSAPPAAREVSHVG